LWATGRLHSTGSRVRILRRGRVREGVG